MQDANIEDGDIIVVDRSLSPRDGDMVVCVIDKEFTAKFIKIEKDGVWLIPANENYKEVKVTEEEEVEVWGIIAHCIKQVTKEDKQMIGIIDGNNSFVSCERVFNPKLRNYPLLF